MDSSQDIAQQKIAQLEARVEALNATIANVLSTLVLHGLLTKATVDKLLADVAALSPQAGGQQVDALKSAYPLAMREAMGPPPDEDDHAH
jgi:outer membrane murein-binding lipoprotein Lpp